jgi:DNA ligase-1
MTLIEIIRSLQQAKGNKAKQALLDEHKGNDLLKAYLKAVYDPAINYYQTKLPAAKEVAREHKSPFAAVSLTYMRELSARQVTGKLAVSFLSSVLGDHDDDGQELIGYIIKRSIGGSVGETMVLNTFPGLFFVPAYMRCGGMDAKVKALYAAMPFFYVQTKMDGQFAYVQRHLDGDVSAFTRAGSYYPHSLALKLTKGLPSGSVVMGELLVYKDGKPLDRKTSNGILNSVLQGDEDAANGNDVRLVAWDMVEEHEFLTGQSETVYSDRLHSLSMLLMLEQTNISAVEHEVVMSTEAAFKLNREAILAGKEGTVWKNPHGLWRDSSSGTKDAIKCKLEFKAEYVVTGKYEGQGKAKGMLGGFNIASTCGKIRSDVGTGFSDDQRKAYWEADTDGWVVSVNANDVINKDGRDTLSLFLPVFDERRLDKTVADDYDAIMKALQTAKESA